jgi:hypothetical protein
VCPDAAPSSFVSNINDDLSFWKDSLYSSTRVTPTQDDLHSLSLLKNLVIDDSGTDRKKMLDTSEV